MQLIGEPKLKLRKEAKDFINLYVSLGEKSENFLPKHIFQGLKNFVKLCYEEVADPSKQYAEINKRILELNASIPGYVDVSLMLYPTETSKAFIYNAKRLQFITKLNYLLDTERVVGKQQTQITNIVNSHDYSIGTPPVTQHNIDFRNSILLGGNAMDLRKFRDVIGINGNVEEAQWNFILDVFDQMVQQSSHYTTKAERDNFLSRSESTVNFKGLDGFIRTFVSGTADTAINLLAGDVFSPEVIRVLEYTNKEEIFEQIKNDHTHLFVLKIKSKKTNVFNESRWTPYLTRIIIIDDSEEARSTNTCLVFAFHNKIINTLNNVHTQKLGALANSQINIRLILDKVNTENIKKFQQGAEQKIQDYDQELQKIKKEQLGETNNIEKDIVLFKFDEFARQIIKDRYSLTKLRDYFSLILKIKDPKSQQQTNNELITEFEKRTKKYYYSNNNNLQIATILEGGGRNQIRTYGQYLLQRKLTTIEGKIIEKCNVIINIIPNTYKRTLYNHFHKNFGINLFLEKYKEHLTKVENEADSKGRFKNFLINIGILETYDKISKEEQKIVEEFVGDLSNLNKISISNEVQMIIRDLFSKDNTRPYILFNQDSSWEYKDLFPDDRFDINPFDITVEIKEDGRIAYQRLQNKLIRIRETFRLFDDTDKIWDLFCENLTIVINDPSNPIGYTDFNSLELINFLKFLSDSKITLFLDEAYNDSVKIDDPEEPKWRTISRYVMNNITAYSKISVVSSISTTKNLGATGSRLGSLIASPAKMEVINFAKKHNSPARGNTNSLYMLVNVLEVAQLSKKIKDMMEEKLPKSASRYKIKEQIEQYIKEEIVKRNQYRNTEKQKKQKVGRYSEFEGSGLHIFLLEELCSLDKLDILELPDDFKYKGQPFFTYYKNQLVSALNKLRVNKNFRNESLKRLERITNIAKQLLHQEQYSDMEIMESDGSFLFNLKIKNFFSFQDLEKFTQRLAQERGIALIPYKTGAIRFSLGGYLTGTEQSYDLFALEFENALTIMLKYWRIFADKKKTNKNTDEILDDLFKNDNNENFLQKILADYHIIKNNTKQLEEKIKISEVKTLYHAFPSDCGITINTISNSQNSVFEFYENIGQCKTLRDFVKSKAFSIIFENLIPQIYKNIPQLKYLSIQTVITKYGKAALLKYIDSKLEYQPNSYILDDPEEITLMKEILIEMEKILFSDAKFKIITLNATNNSSNDSARLEGYNILIRKYIKELLLHFNLPFEQESASPVLTEIMDKATHKFEEIIGLNIATLNIKNYMDDYIKDCSAALYVPHPNLSEQTDLENATTAISGKYIGYVAKMLSQKIVNAEIPFSEKLLRLYLLKKDDQYCKLLQTKITKIYSHIEKVQNKEMKLITEDILSTITIEHYYELAENLFSQKHFKIKNEQLHENVRNIVLFIIDIINKTKHNDYYNKYTHSLIKLVEIEFKQQNSSINQMMQHGITLFKDFKIENNLDSFDNGKLQWINKVMIKCGIIASEQPIQTHTRIVTDAKKREYPFHKIDRTEEKIPLTATDKNSHEYIKKLAVRPTSDFFNTRMSKFIENMDVNDYRCKIVTQGIVKELIIIQKSYIKYLADNYRLLEYSDISLQEAKKFVPDIITFLGAPEKVISFPQIGYFDLAGPNGQIKTLVTPLKKKVDYFGDIKKPRLTMLNEKIKEMGGIPMHGSLFAVELEDGAIFVVQITGDSGVGKSEMLAAMMLKWIRKDLPGIRSLKHIAGDMFHIFPDKEGSLYGIGTEVGDFSRVTDFDPDFINNYSFLFQSSADSNVEDLNSRSTISGLCDISMPYKIDIMLSASNFATEEAGITHFDNPENFILYRDSHGERKEKATSGDNPNFMRTLIRYSDDEKIVDIIDKYGNILDDILNWDRDEIKNKFYLTSSYKLINKIDIEQIVNQIFTTKIFEDEGIKYQINNIKFDIIKNRFITSVQSIPKENNTETKHTKKEFLLDRNIFNSLFNALASTPSGQPFISEQLQVEQKEHLIKILQGHPNGKGKGKNIEFGILSTDLGRKGKEITGPQKASQDMLKLIQKVRIKNPEINKAKQYVKNSVDEKYTGILGENQHNNEILRYNLFLYQLEQMRKAEFVRIDDLKQKVDLSQIKGFNPKNKNEPFCPLLVTPQLNIELTTYTETYEQLMSFPNNLKLAEEFHKVTDKLYQTQGYSEETKINNMLVQLLLLMGYINLEDLTRGKIAEKVNRETLAAAKFSIIRKLAEKNPTNPKTNKTYSKT